MKTYLSKQLFQSFNIKELISPHNKVYLYSCALGKHSLDSQEINSLKNLLSKCELNQRQKYKFPYLISNAIMSRGILRLILADHLSLDKPQNITFQTKQYGKPYIKNNPIHFSVSHCDSMLTIAVSRHFPLGIDVENIHKSIQDDLADFVLSNQELAYYHLQQADLRTKSFLQYWTRKESYLKAIGTGLVNHLNEINTASNYITDNGKTTQYRCHDIFIDSNHICSLSYTNIH